MYQDDDLLPLNSAGTSNLFSFLKQLGQSAPVLEIELPSENQKDTYSSSSKLLIVKPGISKEQLLKASTKRVSNEQKYTEKFQKSFTATNGVSLKKDLAQQLIEKVKGVESVGVGFSTEREGYWPVIRVVADEETCEEIKQHEERKTTLVYKCTATLMESLTTLDSSTSWLEEELTDSIEIVIKYPLKLYKLCSAGDEVETKYLSSRNQVDTRRGTIGYSVCHSIIIFNDVFTSHYEITGYHPVIPSQSAHFQLTLHPLPTINTSLPTSVQHKYVKTCSDPDVIQTTSQSHDLLLLPTLLRATIFPEQAKKGFQLLKQQFNYTTSNICSATISQEPAEFVVGKSGLVKYLMTTDEQDKAEQNYEYNIMESEVKTIHYDHPCNIDIAVLKYTADNRHECDFTNAFLDSQGITWSGPPGQSIEEWKGRVVYIKDKKVHPLSDKLIKFNDPPEPDEYPGHVWYLNPAHNVHVPPGHSGAPVFLVSRDETTFHLLGSLITAASASPLRFSLDMVRDEIAMHHINQILAQQQQLQSYMHTKSANIKPGMIERLKHYRQYLTWHSEHQSLTPLMEDRYIRCELKICGLK